MTPVRIGDKIINLDQVASVTLQDDGERLLIQFAGQKPPDLTIGGTFAAKLLAHVEMIEDERVQKIVRGEKR